MGDEEYDLKATFEEYQIILNALVEKPFKEVNMVIHKLVSQFNKQQDEKEKPAE